MHPRKRIDKQWCNLFCAGIVHQLLKALPESCQSAPDPASRTAAAVASNVAKALKHALCEVEPDISLNTKNGYTSTASQLLACDPDVRS